MRIPFLSLAPMHKEIEREAISALKEVYLSNNYVLGDHVHNFEEEYARFTGTEYCVSVASGLDALVLSLRALEIGSGDKVLVPSNTYIATWLAVTAVGASVVPVEPDRVLRNITVSGLDGIPLDGVRAVIAVHLYGQACEMPELLDWCDRHGIHCIEDNAQAHGAAVDGRRTGSFGHINAHSFYPTKNLGAIGEGGAVTTNDKALAARVESLRNYGQSAKYINEIAGVNSRFDEIQAAFLRVKLPHLEKWNRVRRGLAAIYFEHLSGIDEIGLPQERLDETQVFHLFTLLAEQRDELRTWLAERGIGTAVHYPVPPHLQKAYRGLGYSKGDFPIAEYLADHLLSLPCYPGLGRNNAEEVAGSVRMFFASQAARQK